MKIAVQVEVSPQKMADWLVTAIEGGSNYWCNSIFLSSESRQEYKAKHGKKMESPWYSDPLLFETAFTVQIVYDDAPSGVVQKSLRDFIDAVSKVASQKPALFARLMEDYDASDADELFQQFVLGEVIYG